MKKFAIALGAVAALLASVSAHSATGKITAVKTERNNPGFVYFKFTPAVGGGTLPACATGVETNVQVFVGDTGDGTGAVGTPRVYENTHTLSLILAAYNGAKTVDVFGFNAACDGAGRVLLNTLTLK